jgi:importin subunit beta-1
MVTCLVVRTLGSGYAQEKEARHTAALALAKVAAIELPGQQWSDLVSLLLGNMSVQPPDSGLRQSTLQALGYICEEMGAINDDVLSQQEINSVLTAVVQVLLKSQPRSGSHMSRGKTLMKTKLGICKQCRGIKVARLPVG